MESAINLLGRALGKVSARVSRSTGPRTSEEEAKRVFHIVLASSFVRSWLGQARAPRKG